MSCRKNVTRIEDICAELMEIIDESRADCDNDECELIHCVVHDCVQKMRRVTSQWQPENPIQTTLNLLETEDRTRRAVN